MKLTSHTRRWAVILSLGVVLLAALTPTAVVLPLAIIVPLWFFFATIVSVPISRIDEQWCPQPFSDLPVFSPRPPPSR